jgi:3-hydroxyisobutyrate dehydrogenase-like beta-hydroxyacid dehydrogenase
MRGRFAPWPERPQEPFCRARSVIGRPDLASPRAEVADSPREVAEKCNIIVTMLPGPPKVEQVVAGEGGLLEGTRAGSLIIDMSTSSPALARGCTAITTRYLVSLTSSVEGSEGYGSSVAVVGGGMSQPTSGSQVLNPVLITHCHLCLSLFLL